MGKSAVAWKLAFRWWTYRAFLRTLKDLAREFGLSVGTTKKRLQRSREFMALRENYGDPVDTLPERTWVMNLVGVEADGDFDAGTRLEKKEEARRARRDMKIARKIIGFLPEYAKSAIRKLRIRSAWLPLDFASSNSGAQDPVDRAQVNEEARRLLNDPSALRGRAGELNLDVDDLRRCLQDFLEEEP